MNKETGSDAGFFVGVNFQRIYFAHKALFNKLEKYNR